MKFKMICYTPKGQAEKAMDSFSIRYFAKLKKPVETKLVSDNEFYYIYEFETDKAAINGSNVANSLIVLANLSMRKFWKLVLWLTRRGLKLKEKFGWAKNQLHNWMCKMMKKQVDPKQWEEFEEIIRQMEGTKEDIEEMKIFLDKELFTWEKIE